MRDRPKIKFLRAPFDSTMRFNVSFSSSAEKVEMLPFMRNPGLYSYMNKYDSIPSFYVFDGRNTCYKISDRDFHKLWMLYNPTTLHFSSSYIDDTYRMMTAVAKRLGIPYDKVFKREVRSYLDNQRNLYLQRKTTRSAKAARNSIIRVV